MGRIEELQAQKKVIEEEIRRLKNKDISTDRCRFRIEHFPRGDDWVVSYKNRFHDPSREHFKSIIAARSKEDAINQVQEVINDLIEFQKILKGDKEW